MYPSKNIIENAVNSKRSYHSGRRGGGRRSLVDTLEGAGPLHCFSRQTNGSLRPNARRHGRNAAEAGKQADANDGPDVSCRMPDASPPEGRDRRHDQGRQRQSDPEDRPKARTRALKRGVLVTLWVIDAKGDKARGQDFEAMMQSSGVDSGDQQGAAPEAEAFSSPSRDAVAGVLGACLFCARRLKPARLIGCAGPAHGSPRMQGMTIRGRIAGQGGVPAGSGADLAGCFLSRIAARDATAFATALQANKREATTASSPVSLPRGDTGVEALSRRPMCASGEKAGDFDPTRGSPLAWMATIARNCALDEIRRVRPGSLRRTCPRTSSWPRTKSTARGARTPGGARGAHQLSSGFG